MSQHHFLNKTQSEVEGVIYTLSNLYTGVCLCVCMCTSFLNEATEEEKILVLGTDYLKV